MEKLKVYQDHFVRVDEKGITIFSYFFPNSGSSKTIPWKNLVDYESFDVSNLIPTVDYKIWGKAKY